MVPESFLHTHYLLKLGMKFPSNILFHCVHTEAVFDTGIIQTVKNVPFIS